MRDVFCGAFIFMSGMDAGRLCFNDVDGYTGTHAGLVIIMIGNLVLGVRLLMKRHEEGKPANEIT